MCIIDNLDPLNLKVLLRLHREMAVDYLLVKKKGQRLLQPTKDE
jgi:hypothetical protein